MSGDDAQAPLLRRMTAEDINSVLRIVQVTPEAPQWSRSQFEDLVLPGGAAESTPLTRLGVVAEVLGVVQAFAVTRHLQLPRSLLESSRTQIANINQDDAAYSSEPHSTCELEFIAVDPQARRRSLGTLLMNAVLDLARELGVRHLELEVRASNEAAIRLYTRAGLLIEGRRPAYYAQPQEDAILMSITLPGPLTNHLPSG